MKELLMQPWPWYVAGPLIGLVVPILFFGANKQFGLSSNLMHICAMVAPGKSSLLDYDWRRLGVWNLTFAVGLIFGGFAALTFLTPADSVIRISEMTKADLGALGLTDFRGLVPREIFGLGELLTARGLIMIVGGGFLVGFGSRYAGGCTSGHGITGLSELQLPSLVAVLGFFVGGFLSTFFVLPFIL